MIRGLVVAFVVAIACGLGGCETSPMGNARGAAAATSAAPKAIAPASVSNAASASAAPRPPICVQAIACCHAMEKITGEPCREDFQVPPGTTNRQCEFTLRGYRLRLAVDKKPMIAECPELFAEGP